MYHCHIHFYLTGHRRDLFHVIKGMSPLEHFTHEFSESDTPEQDQIANADVILANLQDMDVRQTLRTLLHDKREEAELILLAESGQIGLLADSFATVKDIWALPMSEEEIAFRFLRWQQTFKTGRDFWESEQLLNATINHVPTLIWYKDREGIHVKVNDCFCETVGKTKQQVEGRDHFYIWDADPDDPANQDCMESDFAVMNSRKTCVTEELVKSGEKLKQLTTYKSPLYDLDGSVMGTVGVAIDVTQERIYEKEITQKNQTLETIFTALECGVMCHTLDGSRIISINKSALDILGYDSQEELMAEGFDMVAASVVDEDKELLRKAIQSLEKEGDSVSVEYRVRHKNNDLLYIMGSIKLIRESGNLAYQRFLLDCTAQKQRENSERQERERRQMELIHALTIDYVLVCFFDLNTGSGNLLQVDNSCVSSFGAAFSGEISLRESMNLYIQNFVYEEDREMVSESFSPEKLRETLAVRKQYYVNYRTVLDGEIKYFQLKAVRAGAWDTSHGMVLGFRSVDEATRYEMEQKGLLEDALLQANRASKAKSTFLSNMSHDIRTPMNAIVGFTTLAMTHIDHKNQVEEYLRKIMASGNHLLNLINDVLDMSRIESGKMRLEEEEHSLPDILQGLRSITLVDIRAKQLELHIDDTDIIHEEIWCDRLRLNQVLLNLLGNSIKYTNAGGSITMRIAEKTGAPAGHAAYEFFIRDTGIGMSTEFVEHIFEPFERERNSTISGIQGTGLGMAITKNLVEMMNGSLKVKSELGVGTEFTVSLTFRLSETKKKKKGMSTTKPKSTKQHTGRILLAEDNELNQEIASAILSEAGFDIEIAGNGQIAVDMLSKSSPGYYQLVLMDIQMPVMGGYDAAKVIRRLPNPGLASIPILAMTANAFEEDRQEALKCGMNGHIAKPIEVDTLFDTLDRILDA